MIPLEELSTEWWSGVIEKEYGACLRIGFVGRLQKRDGEDL